MLTYFNFIFLYRSCLCQSAVGAVSEVLVRSSKKEGQSAVMIASPVQLERSVIYQVNSVDYC